MEWEKEMLKNFFALILKILGLQKFTHISLIIFLAKTLINKAFHIFKNNKKLSAENTFIFFRQFAGINKPNHKRG